MANDSSRGVVILFGGATEVPDDQTWIWDGTNWAEVAGGAGPSARRELSLADDVARQQVLLFSGGDGFPNGDTWVWRDTHIPCPADLTTSSDPNDPDYGEPDGMLDAADFCYYLDAFVAGDLGVADFTTSSDPADPTYGIPDGFLDVSDLFYFLDAFVEGCP